MYVIRLLNNSEYESLPFSRVKNSVGCANPRTKTAYIRKTGIDLFDLGTIQHEIEELLASNSAHSDEDGIRYKGGDTPTYQVPAAPKLPTAEELFATATNYGKTNYPLAYGAREAGLADLAKGLEYYSQYGYKTPTTITPEYYQQWQPTSLEQALATQGFENIWPDLQAQIKHNLSLSGMAYSPQLASTLAKEKGILSTDIGEVLANLGQTRATQALSQEQIANQIASQLGQYSLSSRMAIPPEAAYGTYLETDVNQSNQQAQLNYQQALQQAQADYQAAMAKYNQKSAGISSMSSLGGAALGALLALPTGGMSVLAGAALGGAAGGGLSSLWGGSASPISFQDALSLSSMYNPSQKSIFDIYNPSSTTKTSTSTIPSMEELLGTAQKVY